ncbi:MetQ/NlpA family ABC transporter substrate-binding protein [Enterococcus olivae]
MKKRTLASGIIGVVSTVLLLAGCGSNTEDSATEIRVGTSPGPYSELFLDGIKPILEEQGYTVTETVFEALLQADVALNDGDIDVNVDQHTAYLENFNENSDGDLVGLVSIPTVPAGIFGGRKAQLEDIEEGDIVAIPDDASNAARALLLLEKAGWIKLDSDVDPIEATSSNIAENPLNLDVIEMNSAQIPRSREDIDFGVIPGSIVYSADIPAEESLLSEDILEEYELVVTVKEGNADSDWAQAIVEAYKSDEFLDFVAEQNQDDYWFIPEDLQK